MENEWINWYGGNTLPWGLSPLEVVEIRRRDGSKEVSTARSFSWSYFGLGGRNIVAYRFYKKSADNRLLADGRHNRGYASAKPWGFLGMDFGTQPELVITQSLGKAAAMRLPKEAIQAYMYQRRQGDADRRKYNNKLPGFHRRHTRKDGGRRKTDTAWIDLPFDRRRWAGDRRRIQKAYHRRGLERGISPGRRMGDKSYLQLPHEKRAGGADRRKS